MPYQKDKSSLEAFVNWYFNITDQKCKTIWVPLTDMSCEGTFINMNNDKEATFLFWDKNQPNGETDQNYVAINAPNSLYHDLGGEEPGVCSSCLIDRSLLLRMDGLCDDSYIGDLNILFHIFMLLTRQQILHDKCWVHSGV